MNRITRRNLIGFAAALLLAPLAIQAETIEGRPDDWLDVRRVLEQCTGIYTDLPHYAVVCDYTGAPILGNGEIGAVMEGAAASQTIHLNRNDYFSKALGGLSITAVAGQDPAQYRYEQDIEKAEIRAQVTINGNRTQMTGRMAANEPLFLLNLMNRSARPVAYTLSPWTKGEKDGSVSFFMRGTTTTDGRTLAVYDEDGVVKLGSDDTDRRNWFVERVAGSHDLVTIRNVQTGRYIVAEKDNPKALCRAVDLKETPGAQWKMRGESFNRQSFVNVLTGGLFGCSTKGNPSRHEIRVFPRPAGREALVWCWSYNAANHPFTPANAGHDDGVSWAWREQTERITARAVIACRVLDGGPVEFQGSLQKLTLAPGASVTVVVTVDGKGSGRSSEVKDLAFYRQQAVDRVNRQTPASVAALDAERLQWWRAFWLKSYVDTGDQLLNKYWYGAFYALGSCSRSGKLCPGMFGPWVTTDAPDAANLYYQNYNGQAPFYGVFSGNRAELADPFFKTELDAARFFARQTQLAGYRGSVIPRVFGLLEAPAPPIKPAAAKSRKALHGTQLDATLFNAINFIERYDTTLDPVFLHDTLYPMLRLCVDFFDDYLELEPMPGVPGKSRYVLRRSAAREPSENDVNAIYPLGFLRRTYSAALAASLKLGCDADRRAKWEDILARLSNYPMGVWNGKRLLKEAENDDRIIYSGPGDNVSLLQVVQPGNQIGLGSPPELVEAARNTIRYANQNKNNQSWNQCNNFPIIFAAAARVGWDSADLFHVFRARITKEIRPNLTVCQGGGGIETSGATEAIHSMLFQSHEGVFRFFPGWPKDQDARFVRLRAHGAFLVSADFKGGIVSGVEITSEKGTDCAIVNPWPGKKVQVMRAGKPRELLTGERFTFKTAINETIELTPKDR